MSRCCRIETEHRDQTADHRAHRPSVHITCGQAHRVLDVVAATEETCSQRCMQSAMQSKPTSTRNRRDESSLKRPKSNGLATLFRNPPNDDSSQSVTVVDTMQQKNVCHESVSVQNDDTWEREGGKAEATQEPRVSTRPQVGSVGGTTGWAAV